MSTKSEETSSRKQLRTAVALLGIFALLNAIPMDFPYRHLHDGKPRYNEDDHDVCRVSGWLFVVNLIWYFSLVLSLALNRHAVSQHWALRLLLYPNLVVSCVGLFAMYVLYQSYSNHSEEGFATTMGFLNGMMLAVICIFYNSILENPLKENLRYGRTLIQNTALPFLLVGVVLCYRERQWYVMAILSVIAALFLSGLAKVRKTATQEPYRF